MQLYDLALNSKLFKLKANYSVYCYYDDQDNLEQSFYTVLFCLLKNKMNWCCCSVTQSCLTLCNPMDCNTPGFPVLQHLLEFAQTHVHWSGDYIQPSHPLLSLSPPAFNLSQHQSFPVSQLFTSSGQSIGASASESVFLMNIQGWFPLWLTGSICLQSKGLSRVFSNTIVWKNPFFGIQPSLWPSSHICTWLLGKTIAWARWTFVNKAMSLLFSQSQLSQF